MGTQIDVSQFLAQRKKFEQKIVEHAWSDETFRAELLSNPRGALERELGRKLPEGIEIEVVEEQPNKMAIVLPRNPAAVHASGELSDEALDAASGGLVVTIFVSVLLAQEAEV